MRGTIIRLICVAIVIAATPVAAQDNPWLERRVLNIAHRGGRAEAPEHTLYAYKVALPKLVATLEVDVQRTLDGVLVVHHDDTVDRVTNGSGSVSAMTLAELKELDNAYWYAPICGGRCTGQPPEEYVFRGMATGATPPPPGFTAGDFQIATVREVLETFPDILLSIEIKGTAPDSIPAAEDLADLLREFGRASNVMIASFDDATTAAFKARAPEIHTTPGVAEILSFASAPGPLPEHRAFQIPRMFSGLDVPPLIVGPAHDNDLAVYVFIDRSEETDAVYNELIDLGVDGIITDEPTALQVVLEQRGVAFEQERPVPIKSGLVKSSPLIKVVSKGTFPLPIAPPASTANALSVSNNGGNMTDDLTGGEWKVLGGGIAPKGYKYVNKSAPAGGACKLLLLKRNVIKTVCKGKGTIPDPGPPTMNDDVEVELSLGIDRYCAVGTAPHQVESIGKIIKVKDQPAPAVCPGP